MSSGAPLYSGSGRRISIDKAALHSALGGEEVLTSAKFNVVLRGDFDADGELSLSDFFMLADKVGAATTSPGARRFDLTGDGLVNRDDVELLKQHLDPDHP